MSINPSTNDNISNTFKTLDEIIQSIDKIVKNSNNNNQNTPDKNLVTHLQSIKNILSKLKDVPGTLKKILIGFQEKLEELKKACNTYDYNHIGNSKHGWPNDGNNNNNNNSVKTKEALVSEIQALEETLKRLNLKKDKKQVILDAAKQVEHKEAKRAELKEATQAAKTKAKTKLQERLEGRLRERKAAREAADEVEPAKSGASTTVNTAAQHDVTQSVNSGRNNGSGTSGSGTLNNLSTKLVRSKSTGNISNKNPNPKKKMKEERQNNRAAKQAAPTTVNTAARNAANDDDSETGSDLSDLSALSDELSDYDSGTYPENLSPPKHESTAESSDSDSSDSDSDSSDTTEGSIEVVDNGRHRNRKRGPPKKRILDEINGPMNEDMELVDVNPDGSNISPNRPSANHKVGSTVNVKDGNTFQKYKITKQWDDRTYKLTNSQDKTNIIPKAKPTPDNPSIFEEIDQPTRGGRRLKKNILKRFKSLKTKTTKMTKKTKPTKTTKITKKTRKNKTQTLRHTQRRRQQHQHIRRRTYKKKPNPKPKRNRKVNVKQK